MQFLVYLTILMVSVSTVLLEVHWLTTPPPQPKPALQTASAAAPVPKTEGPNATLSPIYPKKPDPAPVDSASNVQQSGTTDAAPPQRSAVETTGVAAREGEGRPATAAMHATNGVNSFSQQGAVRAEVAMPNNHCDVQACANAYKSFRASDCTYQPFEGSRRFCEKPPMQQAIRERREQTEHRKWIRDADPRDVERSTVGRRTFADDDESEPDFADDGPDRSVIVIRRDLRW